MHTSRALLNNSAGLRVGHLGCGLVIQVSVALHGLG